MLKKPLFIEMVVLVVVVGVLNYIATVKHLYWSTSEFDSVVHFFGGAFVASFFVWFYFFSGFFVPKSRNFVDFLKIAFWGSLFIAVSWEIYELVMGEAEIQQAEYPYDTTLDFIMDLLGILAVVFYAYIREIGNNKNKNES
jgi:hypothetical protein